MWTLLTSVLVGGAALVLAFLCWYVTVFLLIPFTLRSLGVRKKSNERGEVLLEVPPFWKFSEPFYVYIVWNSLNKARVKEVARIFGTDGGEFVPKRASRKWLRLDIFNVVLDLDAKSEKQKEKKKSFFSGRGRASGTPSEKSALRKIVAYLTNSIINCTLYLIFDILRRTEISLQDVKIVKRRDTKPFSIEISDLFFVGDQPKFWKRSIHIGAESVRVTAEKMIGKQDFLLRVEKGVCVSTLLEYRAKTMLLGQWLGLKEDMYLKARIPELQVDALDQRILEAHDLQADVRPGTARPLCRISTLGDGAEISPERVAYQVVANAKSILGKFQLKEQKDGLALDVENATFFLAKKDTEQSSARHMGVSLGVTKLRSINCDIENEVYWHLCSQEDDTPGSRNAFEYVISQKPDAVLRACGLGICIAETADRRTVHFLSDSLVMVMLPDGLARHIVSLTDYINETKSKAAKATTVDNGRTVDVQSELGTKRPARPLVIGAYLNNLCLLVLAAKSTGMAGTKAVSFLFGSSSGTRFEKEPHMKLGGEMRLTGLKNLHFMEVAARRNVNVGSFGFELTPYAKGRKWAIKIKDSYVLWEPDWQDFFDEVKGIIKPLLDLRSNRSVNTAKEKPESANGVAPVPSANGVEQVQVPAEEKFQFRRDCRFFFENFYLEVKFPDDPSAAAHVGFANDFCLNDLYMTGTDLYWIVAGTRVAYAKEWKMSNFNITFKWPVKTVDVSLWKTRIFLPHGFHYGNRWADFWIRLKSYLKRRREIKKPGVVPKKQFADLRIKGWDVEATIQDHPLNGFLLRRLPLWRDEALQRYQRQIEFEARFPELPRVALIVAHAQLLQLNSASYIRRVNALKQKEEESKIRYAPLYPEVIDPPIATLGISVVDFNMFSDEDVQKYGTEEHVRRFMSMDTCKLESRKPAKLKQENWQELGFRTINSDLRGVRLKLKDYATAALSADLLHVNGLFGVGKQAVAKPFVTRTRVGLGVQLGADVAMPISPMKLFIDAEVKSQTMQLCWNHAYMPGLMDFNRQFGRFVGDGKDPSPRPMSFDMMRANHHVRLKVHVDRLAARVGVAGSPYALIEHYVDVTAAPFKFRLSRFRDGDFPLDLSLQNLALKPRTFNQKAKSKIVFKKIYLGLDMKYECRNPERDPTDHYFIPFPKSKEETVLQTAKFVQLEKTITAEDYKDCAVPGERTVWKSELEDIQEWDTWREWRSGAMEMRMKAEVVQLGDRMARRHSDDSYEQTMEAAVVTTDAVTTLMKIARLMGKGGPAVAASPRWQDERFKKRPPSKDSLGAVTRSTRIEAEVNGLAIMLMNNIMPGHGLYLRMDHLNFEQLSAKPADDLSQPSSLKKRAATVDNLLVRLKVPGMDIGGCGPEEDNGFFAHAQAITFTTIPEYADVLRSDGDDEGKIKSMKSFASPFRGISEKDQRCKGKTIEEAESKNKVSIRMLRLFVSPNRRDAIVHWRMALREKKFPLTDYLRSKRKEKKRGPARRQDPVRIREKEILEALHAEELRQRSYRETMLGDDQTENNEEKEATDTILELWPVFHMIVENTQVLFSSPETHGAIFLRSSSMEVNYNQKKKSQSNEDEDIAYENEWIVAANETQLFSVSEKHMQGKHGIAWIPEDDSLRAAVLAGLFEPMTGAPLVLNIMFVSQPSNSEDSEVERVRPSTLYINVPVFSLETKSAQFMIFRRVIDMLNKRLPFASYVQNELGVLQYNLLRSLDTIDEEELDFHALHLKTICHQFEYALETGQEELVQSLLGDNEDPYDARVRYIAKSKAFNTFIHKQLFKDSMKTTSTEGEMYPSIFFSCSFDSIIWKMKDTVSDEPLAELQIENPLFNRVAYVGRGSSLEVTFTDINVENLMKGATYKQVLAVNTEGSNDTSLLSTDSRKVAFKWFHVIIEPVGGINVYDNVTVKVAPLRANLSTRLLKALKNFVVPGSPESESEEVEGGKSTENEEMPDELMQQEQMTQNQRDVVIMRYIYIGEIKLVATFRLVEETTNKVAEFLTAVHNLVIKDHSHMYSSKLWSWNDFLHEIKRIVAKLKSRAINHVIRDKMKLGIAVRDRMRLGGTKKRIRVDGIINMDDDDDDGDDLMSVSLSSPDGTNFVGSEGTAYVTYGDVISVGSTPRNSSTPEELFREMMFIESARSDVKSNSDLEEESTKSGTRTKTGVRSLLPLSFKSRGSLQTKTSMSE